MTHKISSFVKILLNFKKKILAWIKANLLQTHLNLNWLHHFTSKSNLSKPRMEQSVESHSFEKFKAIAPLPILCLYFRFFFVKKKDFSQPEHGNLVLITSTVQVELSKSNFNFDDIRTNFLQALTYYVLSRSLCYDEARH